MATRDAEDGEPRRVTTLHAGLGATLEALKQCVAANRILRSLGEPRVLAADVRHDDLGRLELSTDVAKGRPLGELFDGHTPIERAVAILIEVCGALDAAQGLGVFHGALSPASVFVEGEGNSPLVLVTDFGLGHVVAGEKGDGAADWFPTTPESRKGEPPGPTADVYLVGVLAHGLLAGKPLFDGRTFESIQRSHAIEDPEPLHRMTLARPVPKTLSRIVLRCLVKEAEKRFAGPAELAASLRENLAAGWKADDVERANSGPIWTGDDASTAASAGDDSRADDAASTSPTKDANPSLGPIGAQPRRRTTLSDLREKLGATKSSLRAGGIPRPPVTGGQKPFAPPRAPGITPPPRPPKGKLKSSMRPESSKDTIAPSSVSTLAPGQPDEEDDGTPKPSETPTLAPTADALPAFLPAKSDDEADAKAGHVSGAKDAAKVDAEEPKGKKIDEDAPTAARPLRSRPAAKPPAKKENKWLLPIVVGAIALVAAIGIMMSGGSEKPERKGNPKVAQKARVEPPPKPEPPKVEPPKPEPEEDPPVAVGKAAGTDSAQVRVRDADGEAPDAATDGAGDSAEPAGESADAATGGEDGAPDAVGDTDGDVVAVDPDAEGDDTAEDPDDSAGQSESSSNPRQQARAAVNQAGAARKAGDTAKAIALYKKALRLRKGYAAAAYGLAQLYFNKGDNANAVTYGKMAVRGVPKNARYHLTLGDSYFKQGDKTNAKSHWEKAARLGNELAKKRLAK